MTANEAIGLDGAAFFQNMLVGAIKREKEQAVPLSDLVDHAG